MAAMTSSAMMGSEGEIYAGLAKAVDVSWFRSRNILLWKCLSSNISDMRIRLLVAPRPFAFVIMHMVRISRR